MDDGVFQLAWGKFSLTLGHRPRIMGILNITPDSFSDGGCFFQWDKALARAEQLVADGADILDIGGESTRPSAASVDADEECRRVLPLIEYLAKRIPVPISIDTTKSVVASRAIAAGASIINDISALRFDPRMGEAAAAHDVLVVLMHMRGTPKDMQNNPTYNDPVIEIKDFLSKAAIRAEEFGIPRSRLLIDPGIGFGKTTHHNLHLIHHLSRFKDLGLPLLVGTSRKAFIRKLLSPAGDPLPPSHPLVAIGTQATVAVCAMNGAHILRVHDVAETRATLTLVDAVLTAAPPREPGRGVD